VLVVDKPAGPTSHDVVDRVRQALGERRVGHTGTLDPFATGVLPVCVGKATRLVRFLSEGEKAYHATVRLGFATTTDDLDGEALTPPKEVRVSAADVRTACTGLIGAIQQVPPAYSAKRIAGERSYQLARRGVVVTPTPAAVVIHAIEVGRVEAGEVELDVRCSPGTYVRALARDLGEALGVGGHLVALRRTRSGGFGLDEAVAWNEVVSQGRSRLLPLSAVLTDIPAVRVRGEGLAALRHGRDLSTALVAEGFPQAGVARVRLLDESGALLALAVPRGFGVAAPGLRVEPTLHPDVVLLDG
jgi:tRNA pseudouridine55 synthase